MFEAQDFPVSATSTAALLHRVSFRVLRGESYGYDYATTVGSTLRFRDFAIARTDRLSMLVYTAVLIFLSCRNKYVSSQAHARNRKLVMSSTATLRLTIPTIALFPEDGRHVAHTIPKGAVIQVKTLQGDKLIEVVWEGKTVLMFAQDIRARGESTGAA